jgi:hypothetical protein
VSVGDKYTFVRKLETQFSLQGTIQTTYKQTESALVKSESRECLPYDQSNAIVGVCVEHFLDILEFEHVLSEKGSTTAICARRSIEEKRQGVSDVATLLKKHTISHSDPAFFGRLRNTLS